MKRIKYGALLMIISVVIAVAETEYFGSNWLPESTAEALCDYLCIAIVSIGGTLLIQGAIYTNNP